MNETFSTRVTNESLDAAIAAGKELLFDAERKISSFVLAERHFRQALALAPRNSDVVAHLACAVENQGRVTEALKIYEQALAIDPQCALATKRCPHLKRLLGMHLDADRERFTRFPETTADLSELQESVRRYCLSHVKRGRFSISSSTKIVTIGSCFAANLAQVLSTEGMTACNLAVAEFFNSTYSNLELVEWLLGHVPTASETHLEHFDNKEETAAYLRQADLIVYTVGVAPCFFEAATGKFVMPERTEAVLGAVRGRYVFRTTTVEENHQNLKKMISILRRANPDCQFVFALSPVPLAATLENRSAMEADCLSKSILRVAVEQLLQDFPDCVYWPSFEIVKWLGPYLPGMYGQDDGSARHVTERVVQMIIREFLRIYGNQTLSQRNEHRSQSAKS
jgi:GSCFA family